MVALYEVKDRFLKDIVIPEISPQLAANTYFRFAAAFGRRESKVESLEIGSNVPEWKMHLSGFSEIPALSGN